MTQKPSLPQDLTKLTAEQTEYCIGYLAKLPLKELRRRQAINGEQLKRAFDLHRDDALLNLGVMEDHLIQAVLRRVFGKEVEA